MAGEAKQIICQDQQTIDLVLDSARTLIERRYMNALATDSCSIEPCSSVPDSAIRIGRFKKLVLGKDDIRPRLVSVLHAAGSISNACFLLVRGSANAIEFYLGLRADDQAPMACKTLTASLNGNFPGSRFEMLDTDVGSQLLADVFGMTRDACPSVAALSRVPSRRRMDEPNVSSSGIQGMERFIDAMRGKAYSMLILAQPISAGNTVLRRNALEELYSALSVLGQISYQYSDSMTLSKQHSINQSIADTITRSVSEGYSRSVSTALGTNSGNSSMVNTHFSSLGFGFGSQQGSFSSYGTQTGSSAQWQAGSSHGTQRGTADTSGVTLGMSEGWTLTRTNKAVANLQEQIDRQISRIRSCETYGCWDACAFFVAGEAETARVAAANFHALVCGEDSGSDNIGIRVWSPHDAKISSQLPQLLACLRAMKLPVFTFSRRGSRNSFSIGTMVSSEELPLLMSFPRTSVPGLPVQLMAEFGREVNLISAEPMNRTIVLGSVFHMGSVEKESKVAISLDDLPAHALFAGTSGVGKSTLVSILVNALSRGIGTNFLIVEPVKGEYKYLLGNIPDLQVFTADPLSCRMLRINPFEFPAGIHILTHIDRLIEVFSVCWPLYAAQPALLRECVEEAYMRAGWDLSNSVYIGAGRVKYPDFPLLLRIVPEVIARSKFVGESKGTYEGALLTRIAMLTHGMYGQLFNGSGTVSDSELFDGRVVLDLSSIGSQETLALLMGIMVIRLREHRMVTSRAGNLPLRHILVLEEAHNLFQRSNAQNNEGGESVAGKSVRMLSQCIAEMRSYGQSVFIADQSPGELDPSSIRNTSTKVIMRLSEAKDQDAIARSLSLTEEQVRELAYLPRQVAVIYQGGWIEPVLTQLSDSKVVPSDQVDTITYQDLCRMRGQLVPLILDMYRKRQFHAEALVNALNGLSFVNASKKKEYAALFRAFGQRWLDDGIQGDLHSETIFHARLLTELLACEDMFRTIPVPECKGNAGEVENNPRFRMNCSRWKARINDAVSCYVHGLSDQDRDLLIRLIMLQDEQNYAVIAAHNVLFGRISLDA